MTTDDNDNTTTDAESADEQPDAPTITPIGTTERIEITIEDDGGAVPDGVYRSTPTDTRNGGLTLTNGGEEVEAEGDGGECDCKLCREDEDDSDGPLGGTVPSVNLDDILDELSDSKDDDTPPADPDLLLEAATELETLQRALLQELGDNVTPGDVRPDDNWYAGYEMARKLREAAGCTCDPRSDDACDTCGGKKGGGRA